MTILTNYTHQSVITLILFSYIYWYIFKFSHTSSELL